MQAFMGTVLTLAAGGIDLVFMDEPETFLHPPQARLLGELVAEMSRATDTQVIVATHSDDFVQGVITGSKEDVDVSIVRITRPSDTENKLAQVAPEAIKSIYKDSLLRFSNLLDGIFYKGVVICEAESDCTYYSASLANVEDTDGLGASDLLFTHVGGKDRMARAYSALNAAAVPTAVIADVDLLADKNKFEELFETMGGDFGVVSASYNVLDASVRTLKVEPIRNDVRSKVAEILDRSQNPIIDRRDLTEMLDLLKAESGWKQIKRKGAGAIDTGDPTAAFASVIAACRAVGLFILPVGELERFHPNVGGNKQAWLRQALEHELFKTSGESQDLVRSVRAFVASRQ
ncbi:hypothetical protein GCM10023349_35170 [Nocardioides conyzicola]|uniref:ATPase AAA-type core domain-containing protein n=2 Tax=Nocardioides conyzicola TaxID=1651781 RepID=A0ABP8XQ93_9ACTN